MPMDKRANASQRGYDWEFQQLAKQVLVEEPRCRHCGQPSKLAGHIVSIRFGGVNERSNLQGLCRSCNTKQSYKDNKQSEP
jgi:5-methylcytosine-specific restriction endonuclease McrA